jgi:hypothetical protein|tara:strand:- start:744 stop:962 length:219 start_codon:yes stop_codon:yes gene_type:complete
MNLQTHCELKDIVATKGIQIAKANYSAVQEINTTLIELKVVDENKTHVICKDENRVFHSVPKDAVHNPLNSL